MASKHKIIDKIQLNVDVSELRYVDADEQWVVKLTPLMPGFGDFSEAQRQEHVTAHGKTSVYLCQETVQAKVVVSAMGILVEPNKWPSNVPGRETFKGKIITPA